MPSIPLPAVIVLVCGVTSVFAAAVVPKRTFWSLFTLAGYLAAATALALGLSGGENIEPLRTAFDWLLTATGVCLVTALAGVPGDVDARSRATAALAPGALATAVGAGMLVAWSQDLLVLTMGFAVTLTAVSVPLVRSAEDDEARRAVLLHVVSSTAGFVVFALGVVALVAYAGTLELAGLTSNSVSGAESVRPVSTTAGTFTVTLLLAGLAVVARVPPFATGSELVQKGTNPWSAVLVTVLPRLTATLILLRLLPALCHLGSGSTRTLCLLIAGLAAVLSGTRAVRDRNPRTAVAAALTCHFAGVFAAVAVAAWDLSTPTQSVAGTNQWPGGVAACLLHLVTHVLVGVGLSALLVHVARPERPIDFDEDLEGLGRTQPVAGLCLATHAVAVAGLPPTVGFWSRAFLTGSLVSVPGMPRPLFVTVAVLQGVASVLLVVAAGRWTAAAWFARSRTNVGPRGGEPALAVSVLLAVLVLGVGLVPAPLLEWLRLAAGPTG